MTLATAVVVVTLAVVILVVVDVVVAAAAAAQMALLLLPLVRQSYFVSYLQTHFLKALLQNNFFCLLKVVGSSPLSFMPKISEKPFSVVFLRLLSSSIQTIPFNAEPRKTFFVWSFRVLSAEINKSPWRLEVR